MKSKDYKKLDILNQLTFINNKLKEGSTLTEISLNINVSRKTIGNKFINAGYIFSKPLKQYIKNDEYKSNITVVPVNKSAEIKAISTHEYKSNPNIFKSKDSETKILDIIEKHDNIQEMLEWYNHQKDIVNVDESGLKIDNDKLQGKVKVTTVRLYGEVWENFKTFMDSYKEFKSMDLISMALIEYADKYKK
ncbi:hypothetical protein LGL08_10265 [Clostridium estertheticum]|uniref:hypothetical protein n=1 Tax=Clostridium estertheticum TaxID=238834 RepID=UPI001CF4CB96|nr:hypothetical protein [Clostridium estertheticum]MCB2307252.1 hypothetical protein [Clostridium estertheticum]MCB2344901.1 hypothetical protein [Clostridium estertheticum]MCB2349935.1 hypothetical protein [Clostridium estertheticum]WAG48144.1 hypothetical protein LL127_22120 [Clostridium estertheticum]